MTEKVKLSKYFPISAGLVLQGISALAQQHTQRPNIIFIMSDDHASRAISCYDGSINKTPQIDRLAQNGVRFTNCFCTNAVSGPSRATILTGELSHINGMINNEVVFDSSQLTLPKVLRANGYQTAIVGKWHLKSHPTGFDFWKVFLGQGEYYNPDFIENGKKVHEEGYATELITAEALRWIAARDTTQPFFIMIHNKAPHRPWLPKLENVMAYDSIHIPLPDNFYDDYLHRADPARSQKMSVAKDLVFASDLKIPDPNDTNNIHQVDFERLNPAGQKAWDSVYRLRNKSFFEKPLQGKEFAEWKYQRYMSDYLATIKTVDDEVGKVLDYVKENHLEENTIVVYTSDQGFFLGEHGWFDKRFMYDESYRMPLLIQYPAKLKAGQVNEQMVMNLDFAPTLLEWAGVEKPEQMQGLSFASYMDNSKHLRDATYYHYYEYPGEHNVKRHYGIRTEDYKLIHYYYDVDQWEMFDLKKDPHEMNSVYDDPAYKTIRAELTEQLDKMRIAYGDTSKLVPEKYKVVSNKLFDKNYVLYAPPSLKYPGAGKNPLTDGKIENPAFMNTRIDEHWMGFEGNNMEVTISIGKSIKANEIEIRFLDLPDSWVFPPKNVEFYAVDNLNFEIPLGKPQITKEKRPTGGSIVHYKIPFPHKLPNAIKIKAVNGGVCPKGHPGEGKPAWIFTDEIIAR